VIENLPPFAAVILPLGCLSLLAAAAVTMLLLFHGATRHRNQRQRSVRHDENLLLKSELVPQVAVLAVPPDASAESMRFVRRLAGLYFGRMEIVVVLDGPTPRELDAWKQNFQLQPTVRAARSNFETARVRGVYASAGPSPLLFVDKQRSGCSDALNAALNLTGAPVFAVADWDAAYSEDALLRLIGPMIDEPGRTIAVCAVAPPAPAPGRVARAWRLEYLRSWLCRYAGLSSRNAVLPTPGSLVLFERARAIQAGGFQPAIGAAGCTLDLVIRLHAMALAAGEDYRIPVVTDPVSRPAAPLFGAESRGRQAREQMAVAAALRSHYRMACGFGKIGWLAIPGLFCTRFLLPLIELSTLAMAIPALVLHWMPAADVALLLGATVFFEILVSMTAVVLEPSATGAEIDPRELAAAFLAAIPANLGHRQIRNLQLLADFLRGLRSPHRAVPARTAPLRGGSLITATTGETD
jgi:hypothetical protein